MATWRNTLSKTAKSKSQSLKDEEYVQSLLSKAGIEEEKKKATFLESLIGAMGSFEWTDDALKTIKKGGDFGDFLSSYATDIPKTVWGAVTGNRELVDPDEGKGADLMKALGVDNKAARFGLGLAADILEPTLLVSGAVKGGTKLAAKGTSLLDNIAKAAASNSDDAVKIIGKEFGEDAAKSATKRLAANDDILTVANDYIRKFGKEKGLVEDVKKGAYLGWTPEKGKLIAEGTVPSYIAKTLENPLFAPFEIGGDLLSKTGLAEKGLLKAGKEAVENNVLDKFVYQQGLKKYGDEVVELGSKLGGINTAAQYAAGRTVRDLEKMFKGVSKVEKNKLIAENVQDMLEIGGALPQKTVIGDHLKDLVDEKLISNDELENVVSKLKAVKKATGEDILTSDFNRLIEDDTVQKVLKSSMGDSYKFVSDRIDFMGQQAAQWEDFLSKVGYKGSSAIESVADVNNLRQAINSSDLADVDKNFYNRYLSDQFESNLNIVKPRSDLGLKNMGAGYTRRTYDVDWKTKMKGEGKKGIVDKKERTYKSLADVYVRNKYNDTELIVDTGAKGLVKQISYKAGQDEAVRLVHDAYSVMIEQVNQKMLPGFTVIKKGVKNADVTPTMIKTGVPMLDKAGVRVEKDLWETVKDANKFLLGEVDYDSTLKIMNKMNGWWKGWTTAWSVKIPFTDKELPLNPAYYIRNWMNNKMALNLYGGVGVKDIPVRMHQSTKVWKYLMGKSDGSEVIGNYTVKQLADDFARHGGLGGTNYEDIQRAIGGTKGLEEKIQNIMGRGDLAQEIEVSDKIAVFIDQKLKNVGSNLAMDKVRFALFDYARLTDFENKAMRPLFAFYIWNKSNLVSLFTTLAKDPKKVNIFSDVFESMDAFADSNNTQIQEILPDYLRDAYSMVLGNDSDIGVVSGFGTQIEAASQLFGTDMGETAKGLFSQLSPMYRLPIEATADYNFFKDEKISEDDSAYSYRNLPDNVRKLMGITESTFTTDSGKEVTSYKMNPSFKYGLENFRPASNILKMFNIATDEGVKGEAMLDLMNYLTGVRYQQYDSEYLKKQYETEKFKERMQQLMDAGYVNEYKNYYVPKDKK